MFKIQAVQEINKQQEYARLCGTEAKDGYFAYSMTDVETGDLMGFSQFEIGDGYAFISDIKPVIGLDDFEAMFILGRQTMNFIDLCGVHILKASSETADESFLKAIGFKPDGEIFSVNTTGMFDGNCHH